MHLSQPYESAAVRAVTGPAIRPGGLELTRRAARYCRLTDGDRVLDAGCGAGATLDFLKSRCGAEAIGVDLSASLLTEAKQGRSGPNLIRANTMALPIKTARMKAVFCECALSLLPDPAHALEEFQRVLRAHGHLVVTDLYRRADGQMAPTGSATGGGCMKGAVDRRTMIQRLKTAGFEIRLWEDHSDLLKKLAARLVWAGISLSQWWDVDCSSSRKSRPWRPGYCLIIAH